MCYVNVLTLLVEQSTYSGSQSKLYLENKQKDPHNKENLIIPIKVYCQLNNSFIASGRKKRY